MKRNEQKQASRASWRLRDEATERPVVEGSRVVASKNDEGVEGETAPSRSAIFFQ